MTYRKTMLSASIIAALMFTGVAFAHDSNINKVQPSKTHQTYDGQQQASQNPSSNTQSNNVKNQKNAQNLKGVVVVGIRASLQQSLQTKRNADAIVTAVTAEDLGKFPNTNAAESLSLSPGITVDRLFGMGARVSIDGTNPDLNLTLLDGHPVAQTVWRYAQNPERGFNFRMIAPDMLGRIEVFKSQQAKLPAGSLGGTIIMHTRMPLDLKANSLSGQVGWNYNDQASQGRPQASVFYSWKNQADTFGVDVALQHYEEQFDRQGEEIFGWTRLSTFAAAGNTYVQNAIANGQLNPNDYVPEEINSAWFQQHVKRNSAKVNLQWRPTDHFEGTLGLLYIKQDFTNYNQSGYNFMTQGGTLKDDDLFIPSTNGLIVGGHSVPAAGSDTGIIYDNDVRPSEITTKGANLKLAWNYNTWALNGRLGYSQAKNPSVGQMFIEAAYDLPYSWGLHQGWQPDDPAAAKDPANWGAHGGFFGNYNIFSTKQKDRYGEINFQKFFNGPINTLEVGVRVFDSKTNNGAVSYGGTQPASFAQTGYDGFVNIMQSSSFAGMYPGFTQHINLGAGNVKNWVLNHTSQYPSLAPNGGNAPFTSQETWAYDQLSKAFYVQADYAINALRGNFGIRWVRTRNTGYGYNIPGGTTPTFADLQTFWQSKAGTTTKALPSFTIIYDNGGDVVLRGSMAKVMAWAPFNMMAANESLNGTVYTGSIGNPGLKPYTAYNTNVSVEWYFKPQSVFAVSGFYKNILNQIEQKTVTRHLLNPRSVSDPADFQKTAVGTHGCESDGFCDFQVQEPVGGNSAHVKGLTFAYQQAFNNGFGLVTNLTYATGNSTSGKALPFLSTWSGSVSPYFEKGPFSARININARTKYTGLGYVAGAPASTTDAFTTVSASVGWQFNKHWSLELTGQNLNNTTYYQYQLGTGGQELLADKYTMGRRFSLQLHAKL